MRLQIAGCAWLVAIGMCAPAAAQSREALAESRGIFAEGMALSESGEWEAASQKFRLVMEIHPTPAVSYQLAVALEHMGRYLEADDVLGPVLEDPTAPASVRRSSAELATRVRARLARLTIRITGDATDVEVLVDGQPVPPTLLDRYRVDPGSRTVALTRHGRTLASETVEVAPGGEQTVTLSTTPRAPVVPLPSEVQPAPSSPLAVAEPPPHDDGGGGGVLSQWWFWTVIGVVAVGAVSAAVVAGQPSEPSPVVGNLGLFNVRPVAP